MQLSKNPYRGINAHFQSLLQSTEGGWTTFHHDHIAHLKSAINRQLPPGYYALTEKSLQIQLPVLDDELSAVEIYHTAANRFVTRLELLSPSNKTVHLESYLNMRQAMIKLGVNMVEVDYLHETPSIFHGLLPEGDYPFSIAITSPYREKLSLYCFHIEDAIPTLAIPLRGEESFLLDFGEVYDFTYADDRRAHLLIDYEQFPMNFERYSADDQQRIRAVMDALKKT